MNLDREIKLAGMPVTIIRVVENIETYVYYGHLGHVAGKTRGDPKDVFQAGYYLPTDCEAASGDLLFIDNDYYLLMSFEKVFNNGILTCYRGMLFKCNSIVSIYYFNSSTGEHSILHRSGVHCLITQVRAQDVPDDKALAIREYRGKQTPFQIYMRDSEGLKKEAVLKDQDGRRYKVFKDFDFFVADGITQTQILWENT